MKRTIWWDGQAVTVIDQRYLPHRYVTRRWRTVDDAAEGITVMQVRGAPLIGVAAAHGVALAMAVRATDQALDAALEQLICLPTAVNLRNAGRIDLGVPPARQSAPAARVLSERRPTRTPPPAAPSARSGRASSGTSPTGWTGRSRS